MPEFSEGTGDPFAVDDEELDAWVEEWEEAERQAAGIVRDALANLRGAAAPSGALTAAAAQVRAGLASEHYPLTWVRRAAGLEQELPADDGQLLLALVAATISPRENRAPGRGGSGDSRARAW